MNDTYSKPRRRTHSASTSTSRQTALWKGLPAAILAVLGLGALVFASDRSSRLEQRYRRLAEDATRKREEIVKKLANDVRLLRAGQPQKSNDELIPPDDERRQELKAVWTSERLFYEKLIALNASEPEYRYHFALACINGDSLGEFKRGISLMETLAPLDQVGYPEAHLWWMEHWVQQAMLSRVDQNLAAELVYRHAENCLKRKAGDQNALKRKGDAASMLGRNQDALEAYSELFQNDPFYYENLITLNSRLGKSDNNIEVYRSAKNRIESRLRDKMSVDNWTRHWENYMACMIGMNDHEAAAVRLRQEIGKQIEDGESVNEVFLKQLLAKVLVAIQQKQSPSSAQFTELDVKLLGEALELDSKNIDVLRGLTQIVMSDNLALAEEARKLYDPESDPAAPALILNELGTVALAKKDYEKALKLMERARQKDPRNLTTLNNLAYVYLVSENRNPERALKLVEEAIRSIPNPEVSKVVMTHFMDTKGAALMQLNRMPEAIAAFEIALQGRPTEVKIIESLIKCYEASNLSADAYKQRLEQLTKE